MRQILISIAVFGLVGCGQASNDVDKTIVSLSAPIFVDNNACPFVEVLVEELELKQKAYTSDHPDVRRLISQLERRLEECRNAGKYSAEPDDVPPNSKAFSFNGHTYYVVPLDSVASQAEASR